ncbi:right-handed parallel beta-helix repeat-containing protein (plasmid) [Rhizobium ruizarguesonis]|uniref:right-handed parallel beta-helix repeat-containing protein n=1 Tax=Rhizobium ruizarguesonis TaxID=2081791 RepID=UPI00102FFF57|nr:right-handed parallel beta-helix repeat-containing protein [Rhizobium ruizarguesonis]QND24848.1 right-handed parallel beta-helix repeat-containing protein [Rhizobium leguminosarum bv. viciae]TAT70658.1 right-handed parallel beta-helix repeat-containing protein [Rhizobium ruizarguesonis]TAT75365.1 right-handed parallel beta-helix repeat-containing protein [Rhizobium ruizarguesonis]TAZ66647.1 right-handed parallel beta-helix repeat-containing protein [Rhizobium ruizarguesonis]TAZ91296.1 right
MRRRFELILSILPVMLFPQSGNPAPVGTEIDAPERLQMLVREATCAEAPATFSAKLNGTSLSDVLSSSAGARTIFYVSPDGNDTWSGLLPTANQQGGDGPFASIERARDAAREKGGTNTIALGKGDYYLTQPIVFDPRDRGLILTARCNEAPILHGGLRVRNWAQQADGRWTAPLKLPPDEGVGDLFVNGKRQTRARYPNAPADGDPRKGWLFAAKCEPAIDVWEGNTRFCFHAGDLPAVGDTSGLVVDIVGGYQPGSQWGNDTLPVVSIDGAGRTVYTKGTGYFFTAEGSRYFLTGAKALLDAPGEWWYDLVAGQLHYIPVDQSLPNSVVVAGILPTFFKLDGADGMVVSGLEFRDGAPEGSGKFYTETRGFGAIRIEHADGVKILGNSIENVGVGVHVTESKDALIAGNVIADVAGNGIYVGTNYGTFGKSNGCRILSNHIHDIGKVYIETAGIWFQAADNVRIADNLIENTAQFGIAGGSLWGSNDAVYNAVIEHNEIRNANQQTADGGAIKMMGEQADPLNSTIRSNLVTGTGHLMNRVDGTFWPPGYENTSEWPSPISWAIYTDGKASGLRIEGNTLSGNVAAIGINGGWSNLVAGNVITHGSGAAFRVDIGTGRGWRPPWARPNRIEENVVSVNNDSGIVAYVNTPDLGPGFVQFARNRYSGNLNNKSFRINPEIMRSGEFGSLGDLQKAGADTGSVVAPPE